MRLKKMLSLLAAATIAASSFAAMAVTASAATSTYVPVRNTEYAANEVIFDNDDVTIAVSAAVTVGSPSSQFKTLGDDTFEASIPFRNANNGKTDLLVTPKKDGDLTLYVGIDAKTNSRIVRVAEGTVRADSGAMTFETGTDSTNGKRVYVAEFADLKADTTYIAYAGGFSGEIVKVEFDASESSTPTDVSAEATAYDGFVSNEASVYSVDFNTDAIYSEMVVTSSKLGDGSVADFVGYEGAVTYYLAINKSVAELGTVTVTLK